MVHCGKGELFGVTIRVVFDHVGDPISRPPLSRWSTCSRVLVWAVAVYIPSILRTYFVQPARSSFPVCNACRPLAMSSPQSSRHVLPSVLSPCPPLSALAMSPPQCCDSSTRSHSTRNRRVGGVGRQVEAQMQMQMQMQPLMRPACPSNIFTCVVPWRQPGEDGDGDDNLTQKAQQKEAQSTFSCSAK